MAADASDCPNGGIVRFGVEPYDTAARLVPIYLKVGELIGNKLGCKVEVFVATSYNAEIEAMRNGKLEIGEFGPLRYCSPIRWRRQKRSPPSVLRTASPIHIGPAW